MSKNESIYPITIVLDRYCGIYSGGLYTAWNLLPEEVPKEIDGNDIECMGFWNESKALCGKGDTPAAAVASLIAEISKNGGAAHD